MLFQASCLGLAEKLTHLNHCLHPIAQSEHRAYIKLRFTPRMCQLQIPVVSCLHLQSTLCKTVSSVFLNFKIQHSRSKPQCQKTHLLKSCDSAGRVELPLKLKGKFVFFLNFYLPFHARGMEVNVRQIFATDGFAHR